MRVLLLHPTEEVINKIHEYFPGLELVEKNEDIIVDTKDYKESIDLIRAIRKHCPKYLQEYAEDLSEVMNETRDQG